MTLMSLVLLSACGSAGNSDSTPSSVSNNTIPAVVDDGTNSTAPTPTPSTPVNTASRALVFNGSGVCTDGCGEAGKAVAEAAGLVVTYVTGNEINSSSTPAQIAAFFAGVKVWVMPGGYARNELSSMSAAMKTALKAFIQAGGGYVGWCAGAFAATSTVGTTGSTGLGIVGGRTAVYASGTSIQRTTWFDTTRDFYFEGGPYFHSYGSEVEVVGRYSNSSVAAMRTAYGQGRVFLSGTHPEAPAWWWTGYLSDRDGSDEAQAVQMVRWAAKFE